MGTTTIDAVQMDATEIVAFVRTVPIFHTLSKDQLWQIAEAADVRTCGRDEKANSDRIARQGTKAKPPAGVDG